MGAHLGCVVQGMEEIYKFHTFGRYKHPFPKKVVAIKWRCLVLKVFPEPKGYPGTQVVVVGAVGFLGQVPIHHFSFAKFVYPAPADRE